MKNRLNSLLLVMMIFSLSTMVSQIKLKSLEDFRNPRGEWFQAKEVKLNKDNKELFHFEEGEGCFVNGEKGKTAHFVTNEEFGDIELHIEFLLPKGSNSGIYFQSRYEIQVFDSYGKEDIEHSDCGGIYQRWDESKPKKQKGCEGIPARVNACKPLGEWQSYDVIFRAPRFDKNGQKIKNAMFEQVVFNGVLIHENKEVTGATREGLEGAEVAFAPLKLQGDHGRVAYRNIRVRKLDNVRESKPNEWVNLFEKTKGGPDFDFVSHGDFSQEEVGNMFEHKKKSLKVMYKWDKPSAPYAIAVTKKRYNSYDLKFEFKWGDRRFKPRLHKIRDAGLLFHCQSGTYVWPPSLEYQIQEGDCGDLWCILGAHCNVLKDGKVVPVKKADYSSSKKWQYEEKEGWNSVLLQVRGDKARYYLNGYLINETIDATYGGLILNSGFIALQAEYSELIYKDIKIMEKLNTEW